MRKQQLHTVAKIIAGQSPPSSTYNSTGNGFPFFQGKADFQEKYPRVRMWCNSARAKEAIPGDILMSVRAPVGSVNICDQKSIIGRGLSAIRANSTLNAEFLYYFLKSNEQSIAKLGTGSTFKAITQDTLKEVEILLPSFDDQIRIAYLLSKVEALISRRKRHLQQLNDLLKSVFLEMFGDPVRNQKGWDTLPFHKVGLFISGGTPSKSRDDYWLGSFPWVSPKDMKVSKIKDAEDHISEFVFEETTLKRIPINHLLIVVRGMILAHSFPVAINTVEIAINQDMKAIKPIEGLNVVYLQNCLNSLKRQILKLISTAGHGTKKFDSVAMQKLFVPIPPSVLQGKFADIVEKVDGIKSGYQQSLASLEQLYGVLTQKAFKGELDLLRVPVQEANRIHEQVEKVLTPIISTTERLKTIELPDSVDLQNLKTTQGREVLIGQWLDAYLGQLAGGEAFSTADFLEAAQLRLDTLMQEEVPGLGLAAYEQLKVWVFQALESGRLSQTYDDDGNRVQLSSAKV